jgi:hypothetical protein
VLSNDDTTEVVSVSSAPSTESFNEPTRAQTGGSADEVLPKQQPHPLVLSSEDLNKRFRRFQEAEAGDSIPSVISTEFFDEPKRKLPQFNQAGHGESIEELLPKKQQAHPSVFSLGFFDEPKSPLPRFKQAEHGDSIEELLPEKQSAHPSVFSRGFFDEQTK